MSWGGLYGRGALEALPDGTIISWLRIPGDQTSAAVAFVRSEIETAVDIDGRLIAQGPVVWISPGGWQPMTIEDAGINYPVEVISYGPRPRDDQPTDCRPELPTMLGPFELHGGTWARETALTCAAALVDPENAAVIIAAAEMFETWLNREVDQ